MGYDIFISYSRGDNKEGRVTDLKDQIVSDYLTFTGTPLICFFDESEIKGMADWRERLLTGLRESQILLLVLTPNYLKSSYCEWEVVEFLKYEYTRALQGEGVAQIYFIEIPDLDSLDFNEKATNWIRRVSRRQRIDLRPWYDEGSDALKKKDVRSKMKELGEGLRNRISRLKRIEKAAGNLSAANMNFVGREDEMKQLHENVGLGKVGVLTAVHGMGGLGKTALAIQYAFAYGDFYPGGRWMIGCEGATNLATAIRKLDIELGVELDQADKNDDTRAAKKILLELERRAIEGAEKRKADPHPPAPSVLLILDNVDHAPLIQKPAIDLISGKDFLKIIATTRMGEEELGSGSKNTSLLTVDALPYEDALSLIERFQPEERFPSEAEREKAGEIVRLLEGFTLAVEMVALYLGEKAGRISCSDFLLYLQKYGSLKAIDENAAQNTQEGIPHKEKMIGITLTPTLDLLDEEERLILQCAALLPPDQIPLPWIKAITIKQYPLLGEATEPGLEDPWISAVNRLLSLRLLQVVEVANNSPRLLRMHRIVQEVVNVRNEKKGELVDSLLEHTLERSEYLLENWFKKSEQWEIKPLADFAFLMVGQKQDKAPKLVKWLGQWLSYIYSLNITKELYEKTIDLLQSQPIAERTDIAIHYSNLAIQEKNLGNLPEAKSVLLKAIEIDEKYRDPMHKFLAIRYGNLAGIERELGNLQKAKELQEKAIKIELEALPENHPSIAISYSTLANVERDLGNFQKAKELHEKALKIFLEALPENHPHIATTFNNLAAVERDLGNFQKAKELHEKALKIRFVALPENHPDIAISYNNLADTEKELGNEKAYRDLVLKALHIREQKLSELPASDIRALAFNYFELKEYTKAEQHLRTLQEKGFDIADTHGHLARVLILDGREQEARGAISSALEHLEVATPYVLPRLLFFKILFGLLDGEGISDLTKEMKAALEVEGAHHTWTIQPVIEHLSDRLPEEQQRYLYALVDGIVDESKMEALEGFEGW